MAAMDVESSIPLAAPANRQSTATILCCECGTPIDGTVTGALCESCLRLSVDVSEGIQRDATLHTCRDCDRWLDPPQRWLTASLESRELLALCLRRLRGLHKSRIIDASFIWTEPHSRRIKLKITVQQEVSDGAIMQQTFEVEYVVAYHQCPDCAKSYTHNTWRASVQIRQKVPHKRTFLWLEQLILKMQAHRDTINIREVDSGIDFFFAQRNSADKFVDFLASVTPVRTKKSQQLISMDVHTSQKSYKFSYSIELVPVCKDDLVALPLKMAQQLGGIAPLVLCYRIGTSVGLLDPNTLQTADLASPAYWRAPFYSLADVKSLVEFIVMDIEPVGIVKGRHVLAEATVRRASDLGANDEEFTVRTHLGGILQPGDSAMGYDLGLTNFNSPELDAINDHNKWANTVPDVVLVRKAYPRRHRARGRNWKLRRMGVVESEMAPRKQDVNKQEADYEQFLRDIEEDQEMQSAVNLYKAERKAKAAGTNGAGGVESMAVDSEGAENGAEDAESDEGSDGLQIPMEQLMDEFEDMTMEDS